MTNTDTNTAAAETVTCPKCSGTGHLRAFAHIANGDCFACGTTGTVRSSSLMATAAPAPTAGRVIDTEIGRLAISRFGPRGFQAWHADGMVWFDVTAGRIENVELSIGLIGKVDLCTVRQVLQNACTL